MGYMILTKTEVCMIRFSPNGIQNTTVIGGVMVLPPNETIFLQVALFWNSESSGKRARCDQFTAATARFSGLLTRISAESGIV